MATPEEMDAAAERAAEELAALRREHPEAVALVVDWWKRHYLAAGHRRLGRVLLGLPPRSRREE
ncbi:MAG TPA: hypothetical protein VFB73_19555 [Chloroflexota bacterium]|nr:hypothetical protein [Chloroflexota bacterium]